MFIQNVTDSLVPIVKTVNHMGRFLPPLIYRDGRIILGSGNATKDGGSIKDAVCTTPNGNTGKCLGIFNNYYFENNFPNRLNKVKTCIC